PPVRVLGVIIAGGRSSRFGSDKALATIDAESMLDRIRRKLSQQVDDVVVVGRGGVPDQPAPDLGPLGGLAGGLVFAQAQGYENVLKTGWGLPRLPPHLG